MDGVQREEGEGERERESARVIKDVRGDWDSLVRASESADGSRTMLSFSPSVCVCVCTVSLTTASQIVNKPTAHSSLGDVTKGLSSAHGVYTHTHTRTD